MKRCSLTCRPKPVPIWVAALAAALLFTADRPASASELVQQGQDIAARLCSSCHAVDRAERSPIPIAPAFRRMEPRVDLDQMAERLQDGILSGHPDMPGFVLKENESRALVAYMRSLRDD